MQLRAFKVPGPDGIPNEVYRHCEPTLTPLLGKIFRATFELKYYPEEWKASDTVVLRKPGKTDYTVAKAYRPVALLSCMSKILSRCVADVLVYEAESRNLLAEMQFGGRAGRTTTDSIHLVTKTVKDAWRRSEVASILFLDIKSAFPAATPERLFHDMRMMGIPRAIVDWLRVKLSGRRTRLLFDDYASDLFQIHSGIDRGCPLSVILYSIYNSALIRAAERVKGVTAVGSMDDVALVATGKQFADAHQRARAFMEGTGGANNWSRTHHSEFSPEKFGLLNCSRSTRKLDGLGPALTLGNHTVKPADHHRFLGVLIDHKLRFRQHVSFALAKASAWVAMIRRLGRMQHGLQMSVVRRLYLAVAVPSMLYAADTFLTLIRTVAGRTRKYGSVGAVAKLATVQRQALLVMTGVMRTTATDVLEAHADILPFQLLVDKVCQRATVRLCTLPTKIKTKHPLLPHIKRASQIYVQHHRSSLHELLHTYRKTVAPGRLEEIRPYRHHPAWRAPHSIEMAEDKIAALEAEKRWVAREGIRIYSDGSDIDGRVGAAAVMYRQGRPGFTTLHYYLGSSTEHSVYEAEIVGTILGAWLVKTEHRVVVLASVALDNTSSIDASKLSTPRPGHYLTDIFVDSAREAKAAQPRLDLTLRWVPGHLGVDGNEQADDEAKEAAHGRSSAPRLLPPALQKTLPISAAKAKQLHLTKLKARARDDWHTSRRGVKLKVMCGQLHSPRYGKLVAPLSRRQAAVLIQLRTGHAPLAAHLHRINRADTPTCPSCGDAQETVLHLLVQCPRYAVERARHLGRLGRNSQKLEFLLNAKAALEPLFKFLTATRRFHTTFGALFSGKDEARAREGAPGGAAGARPARQRHR